MDIIQDSIIYSAHAHAGQFRKFTHDPYTVHTCEVADLVASVGGSISMICASHLHDCKEDCGKTRKEIEARFGIEVADLVDMLSDVSTPKDGNRAQRKAIDRAHLAKASPEAKTIKLADIISNTKDIVIHDKNFAKIYLKEKRLVLEVLTEGNPILYGIAQKQINDGLKQLGIK